MRFTEEYKLSSYQDYGVLGEKEHIHLLRDKRNGKMCVKKIMDCVPDDIIEFRKRTKVSFFPELMEVIEKDGKLIVIEEYVEGITLEEYMMGEALDEDETVRIAGQICEALSCLHHSNPVIIYRDLKPENIMITQNGQVKLVDFNISRTFQNGKKRDTVLLGTAGYAAPEQFGYFQTDNRTDIYAFGVLFNYMLTGKVTQEYITEGRYAHVVQKCTEMEPSKRYQSVEEILEEIGIAVQKRDEEIAMEKETEKSWMIPGFRSKTWWKMLVGTLGYLWIVYIGITTDFYGADGSLYDGKRLWLNRIGVVIASLYGVAYSCNYRRIADKMTIFTRRGKWIHVIESVLVCTATVFGVILLLTIVERILGWA